MNHKKRILVISPGIPYPPIDGHKLKIYNLLKILHDDHEVNLIVITNEKINPEAEVFLREVCNKYKIFRFNRIFFFFNLLKSIINPKLPFQVAYYTFNTVKKYLKKTEIDYDIIILNLIRMAGYFDIFKPEKIMLDMVDSIGVNYLRSRKNTSSAIYKVIYSIEAKKLIAFEKQIVKNARITIYVNNEEASYFSKYGHVKWLPNGVNKEIYKVNTVSAEYSKAICFFGAMFYQPNIDAVNWFVKYVFPQINNDIKFYIIGQGPAKSILKLQSDRIIVMGYVRNPYVILNSCLCTVAPMQTGGGIQNKILESMALGQLTITNNRGAKPIIGSVNKHNILIANSPIEFVEIIMEIYNNKPHFQSIGKNARELISSNYSWELYGKKLLELLKL